MAEYYDPIEVVLPTGHPWDQTNYPLGTVTITRTPGGQWIGNCAITKASLFPDLATWAKIYVSITGNDTTGTGTALAPFRTIRKAIQTANTSAVRNVISVSAGFYSRASLPQTTTLDVPMVFVATGGRVVVGTFDTSGVTFAVDGTQTNTYSASFSSTPARVFDTSRKTRFGSYVEMTQVSSAARCNITPNSWFWGSSILYVNRYDGTAPTIGSTEATSNTLALRSLLGMHFQQTTQRTVFFCGEDAQSGFDLYGGSQGALRVSFSTSTSGTRVIVGAENCSMRYAGSPSSLANNASIESVNGITFFNQCDASSSISDGFNFHNVNSAVNGMYTLTQNSSAADCGRAGSLSNNGHTGHENVIGIDLAGKYTGNHGGTVHWIDTSKIWAAGTLATESLGDIIRGGAFPPVEFRVSGTALMHLDLCEPKPFTQADRALLASGGEIRLRRMPVLTGAQAISGTGVITTY
ncbi:DUF1565 domain-containing protein [uncultured Devosia sp.]|uniref:DUF1565 domain-containing protein n=1 Tax=uncultured Devosia sp. TaxID=211434 RepID=UPI0035CC7C14